MFALVIAVTNAEKFEEHLIGQLFTYRTKMKSNHEGESMFFRRVSLYGLRCCFGRESREKRALMKAQKEL